MVINLSAVFSSVSNNTAKRKINKRYGLMFISIKLLTLISILLSTNSYALSTLTAVVDKNPAMMNESIVLTVTADDDVDREDLDISSLAKDFIVGQTRVSSQTSIVNFDATRTTTWKIILIARKTGQLEIPSLAINNIQTNPINLNVVEAKSQGNNHQSDIFITSELSSNEVYVQQSLTLSIKLHFSVELHSASMEQPAFTGAIIEKMGEDKQSDGIINGKRYRIIEQTYSVTPEQSGEFIIKGPVFSGDVSNGSSRRSAFRSFTQTKPVSVIGDDIKITVLPIPANYPSYDQWLPTELLSLHQEWQASNGQYIVGEPITRTIRLTAVGLSKAQLPKLVMPDIQGMKVYPDQEEVHSSLRDNRLISQKVQNFALMPSSAGEFIIPEMRVSWFNTVTRKVESATLPSQTISVKASENGADNVSSPLNNIPMMDVTNATAQNTSLDNPKTECDKEGLVKVNSAGNLPWLLLALWLVTLLSWFIHVIYLNRKTTKGGDKQAKTTNKTSNPSAALLKACKQNKADEALSLVLPWAQYLLVDVTLGDEIKSISQAQQVFKDEGFNEAVNTLQAHLYGQTATSDSNKWQGTALYNAVERLNKNKLATPFASTTISLNP